MYSAKAYSKTSPGSLGMLYGRSNAIHVLHSGNFKVLWIAILTLADLQLYPWPGILSLLRELTRECTPFQLKERKLGDLRHFFSIHL